MSSMEKNKQIQEQMYLVQLEMSMSEVELASLRHEQEELGKCAGELRARDDAFGQWVRDTHKLNHVFFRRQVVGHAIHRMVRHIEWLRSEVDELAKKLSPAP